jgi:hypothetical protein
MRILTNLTQPEFVGIIDPAASNIMQCNRATCEWKCLLST